MSFPADTQFDTSQMDSVISQVTCRWIPNMGSGWDMHYDSQGPASVRQSWVAPFSTPFDAAYFSLALRQMLSWNRDLYPQSHFYDMRASGGKKYTPRPLVVTNISLTPLQANQTPDVYPNFFMSPENANEIINNGNLGGGGNWVPTPASYSDSSSTSISPQGCQCTFPAIIADKYQVDITWAPDEFTNRFGIRYAKVEIEPSIRTASVRGKNLGVAPLDNNGNAVTGDKTKINSVDSGWPMREPQLLVKVTYPWVRLVAPNLQAIVSAGPLVDSVIFGDPGVIPQGLYLGCINTKSFMGFKPQTVLYQSAELVEKVSPVSGRLGYQITHVFLVNPITSWNHTIYQGDITDASISNPGADQDTPMFPYGAMVLRKKDGTVVLKNASPVFPYISKDFDNLLYYQDGVPNDEA